MPKLPDHRALGDQPRLDISRGIPHYSAAGFTAGAEAMGEALEKLGRGVESFASSMKGRADKEQAENDQLEMARARSNFITGKIELDERYNSDPDYTTSRERYNDELAALQQSSAGMIRNPRRRELFHLSTTDDVARGHARMNETIRRQENDAVLADANNRLDHNLRMASRATDPADINKVIEESNGLIDGLVARGTITAAQAQQQKRQWAARYGETWWNAQSPERQEEIRRGVAVPIGTTGLPARGAPQGRGAPSVGPGAVPVGTSGDRGGSGVAGPDEEPGLSDDTVPIGTTAGPEGGRRVQDPAPRAGSTSARVDNDRLVVDGLPIEYLGDPKKTYSRAAANPFKAIVVHHTGGPTMDSALNTLNYGDPSRGGGKFGYHFYIDTDGSVVQGVPLSKRTNHVKGPFATARKDKSDVDNGNSIGISFVGSGEPNERQMESAKRLAGSLMSHYGISAQNVYGHGELQTDRSKNEGMALVRAIRGGEIGTDAPLPNSNIRVARIDRLPVGRIIDEEARAAGMDPALLKVYADIESSGRANAITGRYKGVFQLSDETFRQNGGSGNILDARANTRAAIALFKSNQEWFEQQFGRPPTATELYLTHQQGRGGITAHINNPDAPAWQNMAATGEGQSRGAKWAKSAVWGNIPSDQKGRFTGGVESVTSRDFIAMWDSRVGLTAGSRVAVAGGEQATATGTPLDFIPPDRVATLFRQSETRINQERSRGSSERTAEIDRMMIEAERGAIALPPRSLIENDPQLAEPARNTMLRRYDRAAQYVNATDDALRRFNDPNAGPYNPYVKDDRDAVEMVYQRLGADQAALGAVIQRTKMVPQSVSVGIRGALASADPKRTEDALQLSSNLMASHPQIFTKAEGENDIEQATLLFRHYVDDLGFSANAAAAKYIEMQTPEYKSKVQARIKNENLNEIVKKSLNVGELGSAFDDSFMGLRRNPQIGFDPEQRQAMYTDYVEAFREQYLVTGDVNVAKRIAQSQLKKVWGVTNVNGSGVVMRYPPERAPAYSGVTNAADLIAGEAVSAIKQETGQDVQRSSLRLMPVPGGRTSSAYWSGEAPPYLVAWQDKNGVVHTLNPGRALVVDPKTMKQQQTEQRQQQFQQLQDVQQRAAPRPPGQRRTGRLSPENFGESPQPENLHDFGGDVTLPGDE